VAHDFKNMQGVILGRAELALMEITPSDQHYAEFREIQKVAERSVDLTRQLLAFARKQTIAPRVLDLNETVDGMLKMLRRLIGEDIDLAWEPVTNVWPVKMDPAQVDQILANLCVNAKDAISGSGKATIRTNNMVLKEEDCTKHAGLAPGDYVMLAVSDDGCGMEKGILDNIFEPFFTTKEVGKGTGLGLSTVYGIVRQNEGTVSVESEPGKGTTFKLYIPRHSGEDEAPARTVSDEMPMGNGETVLLVEDDPGILEICKTTLERLGYMVLAANAPDEAMGTARNHPGDIRLLMTDVVMPRMSGRELAASVVKIQPGIRTLYMSGYTANVIAHHGVLDEGVHFIGKPFTPDSLARKVGEAIGNAERGTRSSGRGTG
jgi:CheY-like chemotaxis protein